jgi:hypothetical protein
MAAMRAVITRRFLIEEAADSADKKSTLEPTQQLPLLLHRVKSPSGGQGVYQGPCRHDGAWPAGNGR